VTLRRLLPAAMGVALVATPVGLALAANPAPDPAPTARVLHAPLGGQASAAAAMRDAGRGRLEREHVGLARAYDRLTGRRTGAGARSCCAGRAPRPGPGAARSRAQGRRRRAV